jgi:predicted nucleic acid-binding protein
VQAGLIDTDVLIDALRNVPQAVGFLASQQTGGSIAISVITAMELVAGCRDARELSLLDQFLLNFSILPMSASASSSAHQLMRAHTLGHGLTVPDALIAASALEHGGILFT